MNPTVDGGEFGKKAITVHLRDDVVIVAIGEQGIRKNRLFCGYLLSRRIRLQLSKGVDYNSSATTVGCQKWHSREGDSDVR